MNVIQKIFSVMAIMLINFPLLSMPTNPGAQTNRGIGDSNLSTEIPTNYTPPAPRNITAIFDNGQEGPYRELFTNDPNNPKYTNNPVTNTFLQGLTTETKSPLYVSESIIQNLVARQTIVQDFLNLTDQELTNKYEDTKQFSSDQYRATFQNICKILDLNITKTQDAFNKFVTTPNDDPDKENLFKNAISINNQFSADVKNLTNSVAQQLFNGDLNKAEFLISNINENYLPYKNSFDPSQWAIGNTSDGSYLLLPKDGNGNINPTGLNFDHLTGLNGTEISNLFDDFNKNIKVGTTTIHTDINAGMLSLLDIFKISSSPSQDPLVVNFNSENNARSNFYIIGHGSAETETAAGHLAGIDTDFFKEKILPTLVSNCFINTFTIESCYGAVDNLKAAFGTDLLPFTIISGLSAYTTLSYLQATSINNIAKILNQESKLYVDYKPFSSQEELNKEIANFNKFNDYYNLMVTNIGDGIANIFNNRSQDSVQGITSSPSIQIAGTTDLQTLDYVRKNIQQISNIKNKTTQSNDESFYYNLEKGGGILLSSETIIAPIVIKIGSELPFIVPLSIGEKIHYMKEFTIEDPSITTEMFITQSIKPFIDQMIKANTTIGNKTIIIDSLKTKDGIVTLVINKDHARYTIKDEPKGFFGKQPLHTIPLSNETSIWSWSSASNFKDLLKQGRDRATLVELEIEKIKGISTTIHDRQEKLRLIQKLTEKIDWYNYSQTHDLSNKNAIYNAILDVINQTNSPLTADFLLNLSPHELEIIAHVINHTMDTVANEKTHAMLDQTFTMIHEEIIRRELITTMSEKMKIGDEALIDWYMGLTLDAQILIKYEFNTQVEEGTILSQDPDTLTNKERAMLQSYLEETKSIATVATQIADLEAKINALTSPRDETKFNAYIKDHYNELIDNPDKTAFLDWIIALDETEKAPINLDIIAFFAKEAFNDPALITYQSNNLNITELFELKVNLESFLNVSNADQLTILNKASILNKNPIDQNAFNPILTQTLNSLDQAIISSFKDINKNEKILLLIPDPTDVYGQIFKDLPFTKQQKIIELLNSKFPIDPQDLLTYQASLVDQRIKTAKTQQDFTNLSNDITDAKIILTKQQSDLLKTSFTTEEEAQNKALSEHLPFPDAGFTGTTTFDPQALNEENNQALNIDGNPSNPNDPTHSIPSNTTPTQAENPYQQDDELKTEYEEAITNQTNEKNAENTINESNQEEQSEALKNPAITPSFEI